MKTFGIIGITLAIFVSMNFASCKTDNEIIENKEEIASKIKKIKEIKQAYSSGDKYSAIFSYDDKNRLVNIITKKEDREWSDDCTWGNNIVISPCCTYNLRNGLIISSSFGEEFKYSSSNQLLSIIDDDNSNLYTWENGNLVRFEKQYHNEFHNILHIFYSDKTCEGYFPLMAGALFYQFNCSALFYDDLGILMAHPELTGTKIKNLPNKIVSVDNSIPSVLVSYLLEYTFTKDGYIESCTVIEESDYGKETMIVTFKWQ